MASTLFVDGTTPVVASWLNDVNNAVYNGVFPVSPTFVNLTSSGTLTVGGAATFDSTLTTVGNATIGGTLTVPSITLNSILLSGATGSSAIGFEASGTGAVLRTLQSKSRDWVSVLDFGADPTGVSDSSAAFTEALATSYLVYVPPANSGAQYIVHDVTIPGGCTVFAYGAQFKDQAGANWMFKLTGYSARLLGAYVYSALNCSQAVVIVENGVLVELQGIRIYNCINGIRIQATTGNYTDHVQLVDCYVDTFTGIGFQAGPNCSETRAVNCYVDAGLVSGTGGLIPRAGTTGFYLYGTGSTYAYGGHCFTQCQASNTQDGWYFNNSNLVNLVGCISDDNSARGFAFDGTTNLCTMTGCFTGPAWVGLYAGGTVQTVWATGLTTINNGSIVSGYGSNFYTSATAGYNGYTMPGSAYDVQVASTADITVDAAGWLASQGSAHAYNVASGANLALTGARQLDFSSNTAVATTTTAYIGPGGQLAFDGESVWVAPFNCVVQQMYVQFTAAPGAGTITVTMRVNGSNTALTTGALTGSGVFSSNIVNGTQVAIAKGQVVTVGVVTNGIPAVTFVNGYLMLLPQP